MVGSWLLLPCLALFALWAGATATLAVRQRHYIYHPATSDTPPPAGFAEIHTGGRLLGWWHKARPGRTTLVVFHGNSGTLARIARKMEPLVGEGHGLVAATYRGFEGNAGPLDEPGLYQDAAALLASLNEAGLDPAETVLYGESLGTAPALEMAVRGKGMALVLEAPFSSVVSLARRRYPWALPGLFLKDRFDNASRIGRVLVPCLILHGDADATTPLAEALDLKELAGGATLTVIAGAGHLDLYDKGALPCLLSFLQALPIPLAGCQDPGDEG